MHVQSRTPPAPRRDRFAGEVREQLHQVHSREATGEFAREVEHSTSAGVVRLGRRHQENVGAFPNRFQAKRIPDLFGRHANVGRSQVFSKISLVWFKSHSSE